MNKWWGYLHSNGSIQAKRFFDQKDIESARESDFVLAVSWVFDAVNREDALMQLEEIFK